ncbi:MAG TPA: chorismate mutase [Candidatus Limnocylindria bacterium]|nr:chorismate mutase [Candidatus Limnocylindria bacterium]
MTEQHTSDPLVELRTQITDLTSQLLDVFSERGDVALAIAAEKQDRGASRIRDPEREQAVIDRAVANNLGPFSDESVARFVQFVMDEASQLQADATGLPLEANTVVQKGTAV